MNYKAFTLIELIVVIIIIGILASIALPQYGRYIEGTRTSEALEILGAIRQAQVRYGMEQAVFARDVPDLDLDLASISSTAGRYFDFDGAQGSGNPAPDDGIDNIVGLATRNGIQVTGGYNTSYQVAIRESGAIEASEGAPVVVHIWNETY